MILQTFGIGGRHLDCNLQRRSAVLGDISPIHCRLRVNLYSSARNLIAALHTGRKNGGRSDIPQRHIKISERGIQRSGQLDAVIDPQGPRDRPVDQQCFFAGLAGGLPEGFGLKNMPAKRCVPFIQRFTGFVNHEAGDSGGSRPRSGGDRAPGSRRQGWKGCNHSGKPALFNQLFGYRHAAFRGKFGNQVGQGGIQTQH